MDYSLLLCISENSNYTKPRLEENNREQIKILKAKFETTRTRHTFMSKNGRFIYHLGLIDYLQDYHFEKKVENFLKETMMLGGSK